MKTSTNSFINRCITASLMTVSLIAIRQTPALSEVVEIDGGRVHTTASGLIEENVESEDGSLSIGGPYPGSAPNQPTQTWPEIADEISQDSANSIGSSACDQPDQLNLVCVNF